MIANLESLIIAIKESNIPAIEYCINQGVNVNKECTCLGGITPLTVAVQDGNIDVVKLLAESTIKQPNYSTITNENVSQCKNIGYFVICHELEKTTRDGLNSGKYTSQESPLGSNLYKWCANILNKTSILLDSPEYDISRLDRHGQNVLHYAIRSGNTAIVDYLLKNYAVITINQRDANWCSPLHIAAQSNINSSELIHYLIANRSDINATNTTGQVPLHYAAQSGQITSVRVLLEHGANVNQFDVHGRSPLSLAVQNSHEDVAMYLASNGTELNHEERFGDTVLYTAVRNKLCETVRCLLNAGAEIVQSHFLLHTAIRLNSVEMVRSLCAAGAVVGIRDNEGYTPLMTACVMQSVEIAEFLLVNGASVNAINHINGLTALHVCVQCAMNTATFAQLLQLLLTYHVDVVACCYHGTPLFHALVVRNLGAAATLIRHGAIDVNQQEPQVGFDCLSLVKKHGNLELVKLVILDGFDFSNLTFDLKSLKAGTSDLVHEYIVAAKGKPLSLRELCRVKIRRRLGVNVWRLVQMLRLPGLMQKYLMFECDFDKEI